MAAWRYEISLLVLKNISLVSALEEKFRMSARPCNILYDSDMYIVSRGCTVIIFLGFHSSAYPLRRPDFGQRPL